MNIIQIIQKNLLKPVVPIIKINGNIDAKQFYKISRALDYIPKKRSLALGLVINSQGGSAVQAMIITKRIKYFCENNQIKLYTFAEDYCASGGYYIHAIGDEAYVDNTSVVGGIGSTTSTTNIKKFLEKRNIEIRKHSLFENQIPIPLIDKFKRKDIKWFQELNNQTQELFIQHIEAYRGNKIKLNQKDKEKHIYNGDCVVGRIALQYGLADYSGNYIEVLSRLYPNANIVDYTKKSLWQKAISLMNKFIIRTQIDNFKAKMIVSVFKNKSIFN